MLTLIKKLNASYGLIDRTCRTCYYWERNHSVYDEDEYSYCHALPPATTEPQFPKTKYSQYCGKWFPSGSPPPSGPDGKIKRIMEASTSNIVGSAIIASAIEILKVVLKGDQYEFFNDDFDRTGISSKSTVKAELDKKTVTVTINSTIYETKYELTDNLENRLANRDAMDYIFTEDILSSLQSLIYHYDAMRRVSADGILDTDDLTLDNVFMPHLSKTLGSILGYSGKEYDDVMEIIKAKLEANSARLNKENASDLKA